MRAWNQEMREGKALTSRIADSTMPEFLQRPEPGKKKRTKAEHSRECVSLSVRHSAPTACKRRPDQKVGPFWRRGIETQA